jgi:hypothetical protein
MLKNLQNHIVLWIQSRTGLSSGFLISLAVAGCAALRQPSGRRGPGRLPPPGRASLYLRSGVTRQAAYTLFDLAADVSGCAGYAVIIHGSDPFRYGRRGLPRATLWSAMQREPADNVPTTPHIRLLFAESPAV